MHITGFLESLSRDFRRALRGLPRRPAFTIAAVLTLALGLGATTAIFSVVYSVLIKPLPFPNADDLVRIHHPASGLDTADLATSPSMYFTYRKENRTFAELGVWSDGGQTFTSGGETVRIRSLRVGYGMLQALGVQPMLGRWFTEKEHGPAAAEGPPPVILSYAFWRSRFDRAESALGRELIIDGRPSVVVGIMPQDFRFDAMASQPDIIVPIVLDPAQANISTLPGGLSALARLRSGVTPAEARADLARMLPIWREAWPMQQGLTREAVEQWKIAPVVVPLKDDLVGNVASTLWLLMGAIGAVLLVACANIANLMLVRADARRQEFAVRAALGAVPTRIARELFVESLVIAALGGVVGLMLAYGGLQLLVSLGPANLPRLGEISVYPPVLLFAAAAALASTLVFGSLTALKHAVHADAGAIGASRGASAGRERTRTRNTLVVVQVALALVLVVSAVLMIRTFAALRNVDPGFAEPGSIQTVRTWAPNELLRDAKAFTRVDREIADAIAALPGVTAVAFTSTLPLETAPFVLEGSVAVEGRPLAGGATPPSRRLKFVSPGYFAAMGTRIIAGRDITWADVDSGGRVALVSEDFAREVAGGPAAAIGMRIRTSNEKDHWREVIGVVQSVKEDGLQAASPSLVYWPILIENAFGFPVLGFVPKAFVIRSERAGTSTFVNEIHTAIWSINSAVPVALERTMQTLYADSLARTSFTLMMLGIAGAMALALGLLGIYGVIAYIVSQRSREIGIRLALGAEPRDVGRMFVCHGLMLAGLGVAIGLVAAFGVTRLMSSLLFGVAPTDPAAYLAAIGVILCAAALASYLPARRAAAVSPVDTLKAE